MMMNRTMSALTASALLATLLGLTSAQAQPATTPEPAKPSATPGLRIVNSDEVAPWTGGAGQFPPEGLCPEGTDPAVVRTADYCRGPTDGYTRGRVEFPDEGYSKPELCQKFFQRASADQAAPIKGWKGNWFIVVTHATVRTAAVYCVKSTDRGLVAVDIEERLKLLDDRVTKLESAPPGVDPARVDALEAVQADQAEQIAGEANRIDALAALQADQAEELLRLAAQKKPGRMHVGFMAGYAGKAGPVAFLTVTGTFLDGHLRLNGRLGFNTGGPDGNEGLGIWGADVMYSGILRDVTFAGGLTVAQRVKLGDMMDTPTLRHFGAVVELGYQLDGTKKWGVEVYGRGEAVRQTYDAPTLGPLDKSVAINAFAGVRLAL